MQPSRRSTGESTELTVRAPDEALADERIRIRVAGLRPGAPVDVTATTTDVDGQEWRATATYRATGDGVASPANQPPNDGDYEGVHPMGLVWSMTPVDEAADPEFATEPTSSHDLTVRAESGGESTATTVTLYRASPDLIRHEVAADGVSGVWWEPAGDGPHPPVVVFHGAGGRAMPARAATFASHGYATLTFGYAPETEIPAKMVEMPLEPITDAIDWFLDRDAVRGDEYGVYGISKGGELALLVASLDDRIRAVVSDSGSCYLLTGTNPGEDERLPSWTLDGEPLPYLLDPEDPSEHREEREDGLVLRGLCDAAIDNAPAERFEAAMIPVEESAARILFLSGTDDLTCPSPYFGAVLVDRLDRAGYDRPYDHLCYEGAGHLVGVPHFPDAWAPTLDGYVFGGDQNARGKAAEDAWPRILETFDATLR